MASVFRRVRWTTEDGRRVSEAEGKRLEAAGQSVRRQEYGSWLAKYLDAGGHRIVLPTSASTKTEARRMAGELERRAERVRLGLEVAPPDDGGGTLRDLMRWWLDTYRQGQPAYATEESGIRLHILGSDLADVRLAQVTASRIEALLRAKAAAGLGPETLNHLRGYISRAFNKARKAGRWTGPNPVVDVDRIRVPRKLPDYLRTEEARGVLEHLPAPWRAFFAVAIYCGLRFGEVAGLRKTEVELGDNPRLTVRRSWSRETTKGGKARVVPVPAECVPFLRAALATSPDDLLFPTQDGRMISRSKRLSPMLRRAMGRAGLVTGYRHKCRRAGCTHTEMAPDRALRRCPDHGAALWPVPQVRPVQFKATRATCASLLIQAGAHPAAVSAVLGHSDVRITMERYAALAPGFLRSEVERLRLGVPAPVEAAPVLAAAGGSEPVGATVVRQGQEENEEGRNPASESSGDSGLETEAGNRIRTGDPQLGKLMLYQLSYSRVAASGSAAKGAASQADRRGAPALRLARSAGRTSG